IEVQSVKVDCKVASRFAHTVMTSTALNKANVSQEAFFEVELPKTAFITNFSMASGRKMEKFSVSVNVAANSNVTFTLTYEELLQRHFGRYEIMIRVKPKQLVHHFEIVADIYEPQGFAFLDTSATFITNELLPLVEKTVTDKRAHLSFSPTLDQQRKCPDCDSTLIDGDFFIKYDVSRAQDLGEIQIVNGYFVHFFSPADLPRLPKNVVFVIDRSGSMRGTKMQQTREALLTILSDLYQEDHFALIVFEGDINTWRPSLSKATEENVKAAKEYAKTIKERGSTNINDALLVAVQMLTEAKKNNTIPENSASMIILLTDGNPNDGWVVNGPVSRYQEKESDDVKRQSFFVNRISVVSIEDMLMRHYDADFPERREATTTAQWKYINTSQNPADQASRGLKIESFMSSERSLSKIQENVRNAIGGNITLFCLGFGYDVDYNFLDVMAKQNDGLARRIYEASDAVLQLQGFYDEVASPLLSEVHFKYPENTVNSLTGSHFKQLFNGSEIVVAGRLNDIEMNDFPVEVSAYGGENDFMVQGQASAQKWDTIFPDQDYIFGDFTERLWAYLTIQQLLEKKYSENRTPNSCLRPVDGDPHFIIELPNKNDALCFNIKDKPGTIFNLVKDPLTGTIVNGQTIGDKKLDPANKGSTYFGRFGIIHEKFGIRLMISTQEILVSEHGKQAKLYWSDSSSIKGLNMDLLVTKDRSLTVTLKNSVKFVIILHKVWKRHPYHQDYLGFYTLDSHLFSQKVHGLLGQFYNGVQFEVSDLFPGKDVDKPDAFMFIKGHRLVVTRGWQKDYRKDVKDGENVPCWFVHDNGTGLIDGDIRDYIVPGLFKTN
ncbi:hypothetical protein NFI96_023976, partial [Prochilodus magdalenae]